ncbi:MAG TPA: transcriptional regulator, partial [Micromonosporaceae bacterium]
MVSLPGIVGHQARTVREFDYPAPAGALIVLHSDGLTDRWSLKSWPGLFDHTPSVVAATLLRDAARPHDDASVLVARLP